MLIWIVTAVVAVQAVGMWLLWRRTASAEAMRARVDRMGEAIAMLSETAEAGFAAVAQELDKQRRVPTLRPTSTRATIARRVVKAANAGETVETIARRESLSEGEVRLHLALAESATRLQAPRPIAVPTPAVSEPEPVEEAPVVAVTPAPRPKAARATTKAAAAAPVAVATPAPAARLASARKGARRAALRA